MDTFHLLKARKFLPYFITQFTGAFNDSLIRRAVEMLITFQGLSGAIPPEQAIFLLLGLFMLPFFTCSAVAGYIADTVRKEKFIQVIKTAEVIIVGVSATGLLGHNLWWCVSGVLGLGIHSSFFGPVKFSLPPQHLEENELIAGNGLIEAGTNVAILMGTILGSALIILSNGALYVSILGLVVAACGLTSSLLIPQAPPDISKVQQRATTIGLMRKLYSDQRNFRITLGISWFWTLGALIVSIFSLVVKDVLQAPEIVVTVFFAIFSIGVGVGSLLCNKILKGEIVATWVPMASIGMAVGLFLFWLCLGFAAGQIVSPIDLLTTFHGILIAISLFVLSASGGLFIVPLYGLLQHLTAPSERSQVIAANNILNAFFMVLGSVALTLGFRLGFSVPSALLGLAVLNVVVAILTCLLLPEALLKSLLQAFFNVVYRAQVKGLEHFNEVGPKALIVANHLSFLDAVMLAAYLPGKITFAVNTEIASRWWVRAALSYVDAIAVDPKNPMGIRALIERLRENRRVVIFPEGRISVTGTLMKVYEGAGVIADKAQAPLIPVRLEGQQYTVFARARKILGWRFCPQLFLTVCPPTQLIVDAKLKGKQRREIVTSKLYDVMTSAMFDTARRPDTLLQALEAIAEFKGSKKEVIKDLLSGSMSLDKLLKNSFILGDLLDAYLKESNIGVLLPNGNAALATFFALHWKAKIPALLNYSHSPAQMKITCELAAIRTVLTSKRFIEQAKLDKYLPVFQAAGINCVYLEDIREGTSTYRKIKAVVRYQLAELKRIFIKSAALKRGEANDGAVILFTSGSEGTPKGVMLSHRNILSNIDQAMSLMPIQPSDAVFNALPMFHSFGLTGGTLLPLFKGLPLMLYPSPLHYRLIPEMVYNEGSTVVFGTPTFLSGYAKKGHAYDFFSVKYVFSGAEKLNETTRNVFNEKFGIRVLEGYGATETSPIISVNTPFYYRRGTVGRFVPGIEYRLEPVPGIEEGGRLFVKGPNVMKGYLKIDQPGILQPPVDGWYDTGDIVSVDAEGFVSIKGRAKRFAKVGGEMVSLTAIEQACDFIWPGIVVAILTEPDEKKGERLILYTTKKDLNREMLSSALKQQGQPDLAIPREIVIRKSLPLLGSGKVDLQALAAERASEILQSDC